MRYIIANDKLPERAKMNLSAMGEVLWFQTNEITYEAISGHPDVFMTKIKDTLVVAPNTPDIFVDTLLSKGIHFQFGKFPVGEKYPETSHYNAMIDNTFILHNVKFTDPIILLNTEGLKKIKVKQGYCQCNCLSLNGKAYVCSDRGIEKSLKEIGANVLYVNPLDIVLDGFLHGFVGGTAGICDDTIVFAGSLNQMICGDQLRKFVLDFGFKIVELYEGPLVDIGGLLFIQDKISQPEK